MKTFIQTISEALKRALLSGPEIVQIQRGDSGKMSGATVVPNERIKSVTVKIFSLLPKYFWMCCARCKLKRWRSFDWFWSKMRFFLFSPFLLRRGKTSLQQDKAHGPALRTDRQQSAILFYPRVAFTCQPRFCTPILKFGGNSEPFIFKWFLSEKVFLTLPGVSYGAETKCAGKYWPCGSSGGSNFEISTFVSRKNS